MSDGHFQVSTGAWPPRAVLITVVLVCLGQVKHTLQKHPPNQSSAIKLILFFQANQPLSHPHSFIWDFPPTSWLLHHSLVVASVASQAWARKMIHWL